MKRISGILSYDGTYFAGYQIQPDQRTVQGELERTLQQIHKGAAVKTTASGRTDAGVHACGQVFHFDTPFSLDESAWMRALNTLLPDDIRVQSIQKVHPEFHARFDVKAKEYHYRILRRSNADVFRRHFCYHFPHDLDVNQMKIGARYLVGTYDFTSFCSAKSELHDHTRTIYKLEIIEEDDELTVMILGSGFLYNMVRIIVGTLLEIGTGIRAAGDVPKMLEDKNRNSTGKTAPAHGLYLWKVVYLK